MKIAFIAAAAALLAASCCPSAPAPSQPVYVAPTKWYSPSPRLKSPRASNFQLEHS